jgi:hypothetical protein
VYGKQSTQTHGYVDADKWHVLYGRIVLVQCLRSAVVQRIHARTGHGNGRRKMLRLRRNSRNQAQLSHDVACTTLKLGGWYVRTCGK